MSRWSADTAHHLVELTRTRVADEADDGETYTVDRFLLDPFDAINLGARLIADAQRALRDQLRDMAAGDCNTCSNLRMVEVEKPNGVKMREHCPDCYDRYAGPVLPPTLPVLIDEEAEVLGR